MKLKKTSILLILILVVFISAVVYFFYNRQTIKEGWWWRRRRRRGPPPPPPQPSTLSLVQVEAPTHSYNTSNFPIISNDATLKTNLTGIYNKLNQNTNYYGSPFPLFQKILWVAIFVPNLLKPLQDIDVNSYNNFLNKYPNTLLGQISKKSSIEVIDEERDRNYGTIKKLLVYTENLSSAYSSGLNTEDTETLNILSSIYNLFYAELESIVKKL